MKKEQQEAQYRAYLQLGFSEAESRIAAGFTEAIEEADRKRHGVNVDPYALLESTRVQR